MAHHDKSTGNEEQVIKTMKLYTDIERIDKELQELGINDGCPIDPEQLNRIDSMHYEGNAAVNFAIEAIGIDSNTLLLDIGSGFGGPARHLANKTGCHVLALELQEDVHEKAKELTARCSRYNNGSTTELPLDKLITHKHGNFLNLEVSYFGMVDGIVSWLVFLHIPDKGALLKQCYQVLGPAGKIFVEDFYQKSPFTESELESLKVDVYCRNLPTKEEYSAAVTSAGFGDLQWVDKTDDWTAYVNDRLTEFKARKSNFVQLHGEPTYEKLLHFYSSVAELFNGGHLGGVRLIAQKSKLECGN